LIPTEELHMSMLDGRVVIVTGGGRGLGRAHCLELAGHGATVVVNDLPGGDGSDPAKEVVAEIEADGGTAVADPTSVSDFDGVAGLVQRTVSQFGRLDGVVNNAGILRDKMLTSMAEEDFDAVIAVHLKGSFNLTHHASLHWRALGKAGKPVSGRIVNTTSGAGLWGNVGQVNYATAKAGLVAMTTVTAMEMGRYGVTANVVSPIARTRMTADLSLGWDEQGEGVDRLDPANTSPAVAWLVSAESGWLTGAVLRVDGDTIMRVKGYEMDDVVRYRTAVGAKLDATKLDSGMRKAYGLVPGGIPTG
jgi:NAD(P)-dependent dehydrogenase (short-subunit alcohol dehydrogenase family)